MPGLGLGTAVEAAGVEDRLGRCYSELLFELGEHARRGGTAVGAAVVARRVVRSHGVEASERLPLPRLTRAERGELGELAE